VLLWRFSPAPSERMITSIQADAWRIVRFNDAAPLLRLQVLRAMLKPI